jgi:hypothetical protein
MLIDADKRRISRELTRDTRIKFKKIDSRVSFYLWFLAFKLPNYPFTKSCLIRVYSRNSRLHCFDLGSSAEICGEEVLLIADC